MRKKIKFICGIILIISCSSLWSQYFSVTNGEFYFFIDESYKTVGNRTYLYAADFNDGISLIKKEEGLFSIINAQFEEAAEIVTDEIIGFREGMILAKRNKVYSFFDYSGNLMVDNLSKAKLFYEGKASVYKGNIAMYINKRGENVFPDLMVDVCYDFRNNFAIVKTMNPDYKFIGGIINDDGVLILPIKYSTLGSFSDGLFCAGISDKVGFIDIQGNFQIAEKYFRAFSFYDGVAAVQYIKDVMRDPLPKNWVLINKKDQIVKLLDSDLTVTSDFSEGFALVAKLVGNERRYGYMDTAGNLLFEPQFDQVTSFKNGFAKVTKKGKHAIANNKGKIIYIDDIFGRK